MGPKSILPGIAAAIIVVNSWAEISPPDAEEERWHGVVTPWFVSAACGENRLRPSRKTTTKGKKRVSDGDPCKAPGFGQEAVFLMTFTFHGQGWEMGNGKA